MQEVIGSNPIFSTFLLRRKISAFESDILHILRSMATDVYQSLFLFPSFAPILSKGNNILLTWL